MRPPAARARWQPSLRVLRIIVLTVARILITGIDRDGESRSVLLTTSQPASLLAEMLCAMGWRYAVIVKDGRKAGEVTFSAREMRRTYWGED